MKTSRFFLVFVAAAFAGIGGCGGCRGGLGSGTNGAKVPADIQAVFNRPRYKGVLWGLRVVDRGSATLLIDSRPDYDFYVGSVRKLFSGENC